MSSTEIVRKLFAAYSRQDEDEFRRLAEEYIDFERRKKHNIVVKELKDALYSNASSRSNFPGKRFRTEAPVPRDNDNGFPLLEIREYYVSWEDLILPQRTRTVLEQIVQEFQIAEILSTYNLRPANKILLCGVPGTGKTYTAQLLSSLLHVPMVHVRFDAIISSYLGETATNLRKVFEFIKTGVWVVLFDEVDIIGKNRDDQHESGEIKRVVNNYLQMLDGFEGNSLVLAATNHPHILDPAIWRRFDEVIELPLPSEEERHQLLTMFLKPLKRESNINLQCLASETVGFSPSDLKGMCLEAMKHAIVAGRDILKDEDVAFARTRYAERHLMKDTNLLCE